MRAHVIVKVEDRDPVEVTAFDLAPLDLRPGPALWVCPLSADRLSGLVDATLSVEANEYDRKRREDEMRAELAEDARARNAEEDRVARSEMEADYRKEEGA